MAKTGKYLYGIIASSAPEFSRPGAIVDFADIYVVPCQDLAAVVGDSEIVDYQHMRKDALAMLLVRHQKVIEKIMELGHAVIPIRLGTFAADDAAVRDILSKGHRLIHEILPKINDKIEIDVAAVWKDFGPAIKEIGQHPEIMELKKTLLGNPQGVTMDDQMKVGLAVKKLLDAKREHVANLIQAALKDLSHDCRAHELMDDQMVVNCAFLISRAEQEGFYARVEGLDAELAGKLNFRCIGPLPPYSFYTLEIKKMDFQELEWARNKLGLLSPVATKNEIKKAYHRAAISFHPDKNPDTPGMDKEFGIVKRAHKILADYCLASEQTRPGEDIPFGEERFQERSILVKVGE